MQHFTNGPENIDNTESVCECLCVCVFRLTSQARAAVVVFPTPGGPESRAALNPDPSSFPPPNLPNLAAAARKQNTHFHTHIQ